MKALTTDTDCPPPTGSMEAITAIQEPPPKREPDHQAKQHAGGSTYRQIFAATTFIGGAQVINILFGMIRNKILAVVLGPAGVGLAGLYTSVTSLAGIVAGCGIPMSGVRKIAEASGRNDQRQIAVTAATLKLFSWVGGLAGMLALIVLAGPIARLAFHDHSIGQSAPINYQLGLIVVAAVVLMEALASNQKAILQGMRRVGELSLCQVLGAIGGTVAAVPLIFIFREKGVAGFLVVAAGCGALASWWFVRRLNLEHVKLSRPELVAAFRGLANVGAAMLMTGLIAAALNFLLRIVVEREFGRYGVGLFQSTYALSTTYVSVVLTAMGTDFYPRLTAVSDDAKSCKRLINEQTEMGVLITLPGVLITLVLAPWILHAVYAAEFVAATDIIRWQILGVGLQVVSWPLGYVSLSKGRGGLFILTEGSIAVIQLLLLFGCIKWRQLEGIGMAFFLLHVTYLPTIMMVARRLIGFSWTRSCVRTLITAVLTAAGVFMLCRYAPAKWSLPGGLVITGLAAAWSLNRLQHLLGKDFLAHSGQSLKRRLGLVRKENGAVPGPAAAAEAKSAPGEAQGAALARPVSAREHADFHDLSGHQGYYVLHRASEPVAQVLMPGHFAVERIFAYASWMRWGRYLADNGYSALRFDYRGCGESTGVFQDFTFSSWLEDCRQWHDFLKRQAPDLPIVLCGIGMGGLLASHLFKEGYGSAMLLWSPSTSGTDALRNTIIRGLATGIAGDEKSGKTWLDYKAKLEQGEPIQAGGYTLTPHLWKEASEINLIVPEPGKSHGTDGSGRPWKIVKLGIAQVPLIPGGGIWQALNPAVHIRIRRIPLNPDLRGFYTENADWIKSALNNHGGQR